MGVIVDEQPIQRHVRSADDNSELMPTTEAQLRQELRKYAVELHKLAYALPNGVGEQALLRLSAHMSNDRRPASLI
jgi:hypothetical protein